jgi:hypothetical protein
LVCGNIRSLFRSGSFTAAARELARYKLDLQEVRWDKGCTKTAGIIFFYTEKEAKITNQEKDFFYTTK